MKAPAKCRQPKPAVKAEEAFAIFKGYLDEFMTETIAPALGKSGDKGYEDAFQTLRSAFICGALGMIRTQLEVYLDRAEARRFLQLAAGESGVARRASRIC